MDDKISDEAKEIRRQYIKEWRKKNKDKVKLYNRTYWERKANNTLNKSNNKKEI